jgi:WD40 repeat protein
MKSVTATLVYFTGALFGINAQRSDIVHVLKHESEVYTASFSPDESLIVTASADKAARLWNRNSGELLYTLRGHVGAVSSAVFSPDGKLVVTASYDKKDKLAILWDAGSGRKLRELSGHTSGINQIAFSPNGEYIATASSDYTVIVWRGRDGKYLRRLVGHRSTIGYVTGVISVKFSGDSKLLVSTSQDRTAKIWDPATGLLIKDIPGHSRDVNYADFSPDNKLIATASATARVWDIRRSTMLFDLKANSGASVQRILFGSNGSELITSGWDQKVRIWDTSNGVLKRTLTTNGFNVAGIIKNTDACLATLSEDGRYLVTASNSNSPEVWELESGKNIFTMVGHTKRCFSAVLTKDNGFALTSSFDGNVVVWKMPFETEVSVPKPKAPPILEARVIRFSENHSSSNNVLNAHEDASLDAIVVNNGKGPAYRLVAMVNATGNLQGINIPNKIDIGTLNPGDSMNISLPISTNHDTEDGNIELSFYLKEGNGFDSEPITISINTQKFKSPTVVIADHKFSNSLGGRIKLGQTVALELLVQNKGQGKAHAVKIMFKNPPNVFPGGENPIMIEGLEPNQAKIISYEFFANKVFTGKEIPIDVVITESYGKYGTSQTMRVSLDQTLQPTKTVVISNQPQESVKIDEVFLEPEQEVAKQTLNLNSELEKTGRPVFYSLFIGVNEYDYSSSKLPNLDKPISDAEALREALTSKYEFANENAVILRNPTRSEIINSLEVLARKITPKDNLLIFYAGHGLWDERLKKGYWLPADSQPNDVSTWIPNSTIKDYVAGIQSKHTLLITDACFGGGIFKTRDVTADINDFAFSKIYRLASRKAMTSGTLTTVPDDSKFMWSLIKHLTEFNGDYLTSRQLFDNLYTSVVNNTNTVPQFGVIQETGDEGGDFIFMKRKTDK